MSLRCCCFVLLFRLILATALDESESYSDFAWRKCVTFNYLQVSCQNTLVSSNWWKWKATLGQLRKFIFQFSQLDHWMQAHYNGDSQLWTSPSKVASGFRVALSKILFFTGCCSEKTLSAWVWVGRKQCNRNQVKPRTFSAEGIIHFKTSSSSLCLYLSH